MTEVGTGRETTLRKSGKEEGVRERDEEAVLQR